MSDVKTAIKAIKYTYRDLSRDTGLSIHTLRSYLKGVREPNEESQEKIMAALVRQATKLNLIAMPAPVYVPAVEAVQWKQEYEIDYADNSTKTVWANGVRIDGSPDEVSGEFRED